MAEQLARIRSRDAAVCAWTWVEPVPPRAREGPLAEITVGVKDVIDVAGMPTAHGSPVFAGQFARADAEAVARLRAAGAIILGKTVTAEFATYHPGPTINPRRPGHTPGGSSSGSAAAVADGQADLALGTQTAGSTIRPASFCGVLGWKPSFGRYPLTGVLETSPSLDTLGLFARSFDLLVIADAVLAGCDAGLPTVAAPRLGICRTPDWQRAEPDMRAAYDHFIERLRLAGATLFDIELPAPFADLAPAQALIHRREAFHALGWIRREHPDQVSPVFRDFIDQGGRETDSAYQAALALSSACGAMLETVFDEADLLITPGATGAAPAGLGATGDPIFQRMWTATGAPCLGFPAAWTELGLPLGLQLVGRPGADRAMLAAAATILPHAIFKGD